MPGACQRIVLCRREDVPPGRAIRVESGALCVAVFNLDGEICVIDDACTHGPGSLSEGEVCDGVVECDFHNGAFDIRTGAVVRPPCMVPVKTYRVEVDGGGAVSIEA